MLFITLVDTYIKYYTYFYTIVYWYNYYEHKAGDIKMS